MKVFLFLVFIMQGMQEPITQQGEMESIEQCFAFAQQIQEEWINRPHDGPYKLTVGCAIQVTPT